MDAQPNNRGGRRRRRRKNKNQKPAEKVEPVVVAARRPDSPRLEKPTRRMKAASAKPRTLRDEAGVSPAKTAAADEAPKKRREARIVQRKEDEVDETEKTRRRLMARYMAAEGRAAITRAADAYFTEGFELPLEQEVHLKLLEHFDEMRAGEAVFALTRLIEEDAPMQLPVLRQRLRRIEEHAEDEELRQAATELRRQLPA